MKLDLSQLYEIVDATTQELKNIDRKMRHAVEDAAAFERANHTYINRTGNLEKSTIGKVTKNLNEFEASLQMNMSYASCVVDKGFSKIDVAAKMAEAEIEDYLRRYGFDV
jgi:hypothetical protein